MLFRSAADGEHHALAEGHDTAAHQADDAERDQAVGRGHRDQKSEPLRAEKPRDGEPRESQGTECHRAAVGALIVGLARSLAVHTAPVAELFSIYIVMAVVLMVRPEGLFQRTQARKI